MAQNRGANNCTFLLTSEDVNNLLKSAERQPKVICSIALHQDRSKSQQRSAIGTIDCNGLLQQGLGWTQLTKSSVNNTKQAENLYTKSDAIQRISQSLMQQER
jgi:hypothetical protein